jgi:casein kinase II subunit beta
MPRSQLQQPQLAPTQPPEVGVLQEDEEIPSAVVEGEEAMIEDPPEDGYASSTPTSSLTWITWFCSLPGHEYFCEVSEDFIEDDFNLTGLNSLVPFWREAMEMVLDVEPEDTLRIPDVSIVESSAELLYGLVHQRYILTRPGLQAMVEKYEAGHFGTCPRVFCESCHVAPCGRYDLPGLDTVKLYCPNCNDIYVPPSSRYQGVDGAFFGTTFPHLLFQSFRELAPAPFCPPPGSTAFSPTRSPAGTPAAIASATPSFVNPNPHGGQKLPTGRVYIPKIFGFRVSERARSGPRMRWLRMRPETPGELDLVDWRGRWIEGDEDDDPYGGSDAGPMEDFDAGVFEDEDDAEEEEEEEDGQPDQPTSAMRGRQNYALSTDPAWDAVPTEKPLALPQRRCRPRRRSNSSSDSTEIETPIEDPPMPIRRKPVGALRAIFLSPKLQTSVGAEGQGLIDVV